MDSQGRAGHRATTNKARKLARQLHNRRLGVIENPGTGRCTLAQLKVS